MLFFIFQIRFSYRLISYLYFLFYFPRGFVNLAGIKAFYECISVSLIAVSYKLLHVFSRYHYVLLAIRFALPISLAQSIIYVCGLFTPSSMERIFLSCLSKTSLKTLGIDLIRNESMSNFQSITLHAPVSHPGPLTSMFVRKHYLRITSKPPPHFSHYLLQ